MTEKRILYVTLGNEGRVIKTLRLDRGYTQRLLAKKVGVSVASISKWELGQSKTPPDKFRRCLSIMGATISTKVSYKPGVNWDDAPDEMTLKEASSFLSIPYPTLYYKTVKGSLAYKKRKFVKYVKKADLQKSLYNIEEVGR